MLPAYAWSPRVDTGAKCGPASSIPYAAVGRTLKNLRLCSQTATSSETRWTRLHRHARAAQQPSDWAKSPPPSALANKPFQQAQCFELPLRLLSVVVLYLVPAFALDSVPDCSVSPGLRVNESMWPRWITRRRSRAMGISRLHAGPCYCLCELREACAATSCWKYCS